MATRRPRNSERSFGISVGTFLCIVAAVFFWRGRNGRAEWTGAIGVLLLAFGLIRPVALRPISDPWWKLAAALGWFNARLLLTVAFGLVLVPLGLLWRVMRKDPLERRRRNWQGWTMPPDRYTDPRHFDRMF
jgi:hypothetical protein